MRSGFLAECELIEQNAIHTAEAHHIVGRWQRWLAYSFQLIPAAIAAVTSTLVAAGAQPEGWLWVTVVSSVTAASASVLNPNAQAASHVSAAKAFTILKRDAIFLRRARAATLSDEALALCVEQLHARYNEAVRTSPPTGPRSFALARERIKAGVHTPDPMETQAIAGV